MAIDFSKYGTPVSTSPEKTGVDFSKYGTPASPTNLVSTTPTANEISASNYGATFPYQEGETPVSGGLKAIGNIPSSLYGFGKNLAGMVTSPVKTLSGLGNLILGGTQKAVKATTGLQLPQTEAVKQADESFNVMGQILKERYGSLDNLARTATNDPFGFGADILAILEGGAGLAGKTSTLTRGLEAVARPITGTVSSVAKIPANTIKFATTQATGLNPETISNIIREPALFTPEALKQTTRQNLGTIVKESIDNRLDNLSDIGSGYNTIREQSGIVEVRPLIKQLENGETTTLNVQSILDKYGIKVVDGKVKTTAEAKPLTSADKTALEDFLNVYGYETQLSNNAFLNTRSALSQLSKYDSAKTGNLVPIARDLRGYYDELGKTQIKGLAELDAQYAPEVKILNQIKKDYLTPSGEFKDGAINKIANLTGTGKEQVLNRLEQIIPGVSQRIKIVKAAEDIERASGLKVGTYVKGAIFGGGVITGNIPAIITAIISSPEIAVRLLRAYGYTNKTAQPIIRILYGIANDVNNFRLPGQVQNYIKEYLRNPKVGLSIQDINRFPEEKAKVQDLLSKSQQIATKKAIQPPIDNIKPDTDSIPPLSNKTPIKSSLLEEAKKYKTAEEFINRYKPKDRIGQSYVEIPSKSISIDEFATPQNKAQEGKIIWSQARTKEVPTNNWIERISKGERPNVVIETETDGTRRIIDGHNRLEAYRKLGFKEIPTIKTSQLEQIWKEANIDERLVPIVDKDGMVTVYRASAKFPVTLPKDTYVSTNPKNVKYYAESWYKGNPSDIKVKSFQVPASKLKRGGTQDNWQLTEDIVWENPNKK